MSESSIDKTMAYGQVQAEIEEHEAIFLVVFGFGGASLILAILYNVIRKKVFGDANSLDQAFDAGGRVSTSLTAVTVAVQLLWPADLLQSATVTSKYGISGGFWYSIAIILNIMCFPLLALRFKTRAPGAKTYLQLMRARFGRGTHLLYCGYALLTNVVTTSTLIVAGVSLYTSIIKDMSSDMVVLIMALLFGSYSFVGGLGSTFYVSYLNALLTLGALSYLVLRIFYQPGGESLPFGTMEEMYDKVASLTGPKDNYQQSYLTFWSMDSLVWAAQGTFICTGVVFVDQASWQSKVAARPKQGSLGFILATLIWFAIPSTIGTSAGMAYLSYSGSVNNTMAGINISSISSSNSSNSSNMLYSDLIPASSMALSQDDVHAGLVTPFIASLALGKKGEIALLTIFTMLMMSTGSGEVMAVASIIVYDIYQTYIRPYRLNHKQDSCILCGKVLQGETTETNHLFNETELCQCPPAIDCGYCHQDQQKRLTQSSRNGWSTFTYSCPHHGQYRAYQEELVRLKDWVVLWVALSVIPLGLLVDRSRMDLNWIFMNGAMLVVQAFPGILLTICWVKVTGKALVIGSLVGLTAGLTASLGRASSMDGGLSNFWHNTSDGYTVLAGCVSCLFGSLLVMFLVSMATHNIRSKADERVEWQKLRDIDNPLRPWTYTVKADGLEVNDNERPSYPEIEKHYRSVKMTTMVGVGVMVVIFVVIIPGTMTALQVMTSQDLRGWLMTLHFWCFLTSLSVLIVTPMEEVCSIFRGMRDKARKMASRENTKSRIKKSWTCFGRTAKSEQEKPLQKFHGETDKGKGDTSTCNNVAV